jgi:hypothetical protein
MMTLGKFSYPLLAALMISFPEAGKAAEEYNNLTCVIDLKTEQPCNIAIHKRSLVAKFANGRAYIVKINRITDWNYSNQSKTKGFIFNWVKHRHVFGISFKDADGEGQTMAVAFNDSQYVQPFQMFLESSSNQE